MVMMVGSVSLCSLCVEVGVSPQPLVWCKATPGARSPSSVCPTASSAGYSGGLAVVTSLTSAGGEMSACRNLFLVMVSKSVLQCMKTTIRNSFYVRILHQKLQKGGALSVPAGP